MKNGFYLFAYIEINKYANFYRIDTKRHDQNISLWEYIDGKLTLLRYWELERLSRIKHHNKAFFSEEQAKNYIQKLLSEFNLSISDLSGFYAYPYFNSKLEEIKNINDDYNFHSFCHLFSALLMETKLFYSNNMLAFSVDLDSDYLSEKKDIKKNDYVGCYSTKGKLQFFPIESPAPLWSVVSHDMKMGEGTLMALASALKTKFKHNFDFSRERFFKNDYNKVQNLYKLIKNLSNECNENNKNEILEDYNNNFSFEDNLKSAIMKVIQSLSEDIMKRNVDNAMQLFRINAKDTILALSGGFSLNCPTNSFLINTFGFKNFIAPPCINDSGQSLGMALYHFYLNSDKKLSFSLNNSYYGKSYSINQAVEKFADFIVKKTDFDVEVAANDTIDNIIVWFDGNSEIGPRALGHRSIISASTSLEVKNKINEIKKRQHWRPVAPLVLEKYGDRWFENFIPSKYMLLTFDIKKKVENIIKAVSHLDKSARIQTVSDKNEKIVRVLERLNEKIGVPILCNTSLNDYKEPIIETPEEAIYFALKKDIKVVYLNGVRLELDIQKSIDNIEKPRGELDLWSENNCIESPALNKEEYDFYYWSSLDNDFSLDNEDSVKIVKRLYNSIKDKINLGTGYQNFYY